MERPPPPPPQEDWGTEAQQWAAWQQWQVAQADWQSQPPDWHSQQPGVHQGAARSADGEPSAKGQCVVDQRELFMQAGGQVGGGKRGKGGRSGQQQAPSSKEQRRAAAAAAAAAVSSLPADTAGLDYLDHYPDVKHLMQRFKNRGQSQFPLAVLNEYATRLMLQVTFATEQEHRMGGFRVEAKLASKRGDEVHESGVGRARNKQTGKQVAAAAVLQRLLESEVVDEEALLEPNAGKPVEKKKWGQAQLRPGLGADASAAASGPPFRRAGGAYGSYGGGGGRFGGGRFGSYGSGGGNGRFSSTPSFVKGGTMVPSADGAGLDLRPDPSSGAARGRFASISASSGYRPPSREAKLSTFEAASLPNADRQFTSSGALRPSSRTRSASALAAGEAGPPRPPSLGGDGTIGSGGSLGLGWGVGGAVALGGVRQPSPSPPRELPQQHSQQAQHAGQQQYAWQYDNSALPAEERRRQAQQQFQQQWHAQWHAQHAAQQQQLQRQLQHQLQQREREAQRTSRWDRDGHGQQAGQEQPPAGTPSRLRSPDRRHSRQADSAERQQEDGDGRSGRRRGSPSYGGRSRSPDRSREARRSGSPKRRHESKHRRRSKSRRRSGSRSRHRRHAGGSKRQRSPSLDAAKGQRKRSRSRSRERSREGRQHRHRSHDRSHEREHKHKHKHRRHRSHERKHERSRSRERKHKRSSPSHSRERRDDSGSRQRLREESRGRSGGETPGGREESRGPSLGISPGGPEEGDLQGPGEVLQQEQQPVVAAVEQEQQMVVAAAAGQEQQPVVAAAAGQEQQPAAAAPKEQEQQSLAAAAGPDVTLEPAASSPAGVDLPTQQPAAAAAAAGVEVALPLPDASAEQPAAEGAEALPPTGSSFRVPPAADDRWQLS